MDTQWYIINFSLLIHTITDLNIDTTVAFLMLQEVKWSTIYPPGVPEISEMNSVAINHYSVEKKKSKYFSLKYSMFSERILNILNHFKLIKYVLLDNGELEMYQNHVTDYI